MKPILKKRTVIIYALLGAILVLSAILRIYRLTDYPNGFNADEAALGYNAYSLIRTGMDEHGAKWPLAFESFGDFKAPLYVYIIMPFVAVMGLTELAVRLPSALFGIATVFILYFLVRRIFQSDMLGLIAAFFLAISPWHLHFSRGGWEVNVATFFITLGVYSFLKAMDKPRWFVVSVLSFLASMYTYQSPKIIVPLLGIGLVILYRRDMWRLKTKLIVPLIVGIIFAIPLVFTVIGGGSSRFSGVSIFGDSGPFWAVNEARGEHPDLASPPAKIFHNKILGYGLDYLKNYSDHYTPAYLFFSGDIIERNNIPEMGVMYVIDGLFVIIGLLYAFASKARDKKVILMWLLIAPAAAAITFQSPHALRSHNMVIPLVIMAACGVYAALKWARHSSRIVTWIVVTLIAVGYGYFFVKYLHIYYKYIPVHLEYANNYGFDELVPYVEGIKGNYDKVVVTDAYDQPYILFLFYNQTNPKAFQNAHVLTPRDKFNFSTVRSFEKYEFRAITPDDLLQSNKVLFVGTDKDISDTDPRIIKVIRLPNGKPVFKIVST